MELRDFERDDEAALIALTIDVFRPFYEESFRAMVPLDVWTHQHGQWPEDYRQMVPSLHRPDQMKWCTVAIDEQEIAGYVAWLIEPERRHGKIDVLAVSSKNRRHGLGRRLCEHALTHMKNLQVEVVEVGTGGDEFHRPARALYSSMGFHLIPIAGYLRSI